MRKRTQRVAFLVTEKERQLLRELATRRGEATSIVIRDLIRKAATTINTETRIDNEVSNDTIAK